MRNDEHRVVLHDWQIVQITTTFSLLVLAEAGKGLYHVSHVLSGFLLTLTFSACVGGRKEGREEGRKFLTL